MASKTVSSPFKIIGSVSVSATSVFTSSVSNILYRDSVSLQYVWTGNPQGTVDVQCSNDYSPGLQQSNGLPETGNTGTWTSIVFSSSPTVVGSGSIMINMNQLSFANIRTVYTNSTGSGVLSLWLAAKSLGV